MLYPVKRRNGKFGMWLLPVFGTKPGQQKKQTVKVERVEIFAENTTRALTVC